MGSVVDHILKGHVSVRNVAFSAAADLFVLHTNDVGGTVDGVGVIVPISLSIAQRDGATLQANEHIGVRVSRFASATVTGTATAYDQSASWSSPALAASLAINSQPDEAYTIDVMCGTLVTGTETVYLADGWNVQQPYLYVWGDDQELAVMYDDGAGDQTAFVVRLENAPSAAIDINATLAFGYMPLVRALEF